MSEMQYKGIANTRIVTRLKQVLILLAIIIAGIAISIATEAKSEVRPAGASVLNM